jgi:hypothetical protein
MTALVDVTDLLSHRKQLSHNLGTVGSDRRTAGHTVAWGSATPTYSYVIGSDEKRPTHGWRQQR